MPGAQLEAGRAFVDLIPRLDKGAAAAAQAQMGGVFGSLSSGAKKAGLAVGAGLAAGAGIAAVGLFKVGQSFDEAFREIRLGTGATGEALEGLKDSFRTVTGNVPDDLGDVATAVADLNTRTGLTGPALEGLATQMLNLSRIAGEDLSSTIESSTRVFGDWGISVEDQEGALDNLWKTSQATGIGLGKLNRQLVAYGAPLRQLGFGFEESAALLGSFEREGVNAELVMGSLRIALGKMAREGEPAQETLARVTDQIANAGDASEANALALELFGARAGPDMAAAIREGRFEIDELMGSIEGSDETVNGAAAEVETFGEKFSKLKNRILVAVEPIATRFLGFLEDVIDNAGPVIGFLERELPKAFKAIGDVIGPIIAGAEQVFRILFERDFTGGPFAEDSDFVAALFNLRDLFVEEVLPVIETVFEFLSKNAKPILAAVAAAFLLLTAPVSTVIAALVAAYFRFEAFRKVVDTVVRFLLREVVPRVIQFASYVAEQFSNLVGFVEENWGAIEEAISHVVSVIEGIVSGFVDAVLLVWENFGDTILAVIEGAWENVQAVIELAVDIIAGVIEATLAIINGDWGEAWDAIVGILESTWETIKTVIGNAFDVVATLFSDGMNAAKDLVTGVLDEIIGFFGSLGSDLSDAAGDVFGFLWEAFKDAVNLIIRGWNSLEFKIPGFDPPGPGPKFGGFTLGVPEIPELALGADVTRAGLAIVGEDGPELLDLDAGARVTPLDTAAMISAAAGARGAGGPLIGKVEVPTAVDATADEVVDAIFAKAGWKLTVRRDR